MDLLKRMSRRLRNDVRNVIGNERPNDAGMTTAEYAVGTIAAVAFAAVLYKVVTSDAIKAALSAILQSALQINL